MRCERSLQQYGEVLKKLVVGTNLDGSSLLFRLGVVAGLNFMITLALTSMRGVATDEQCSGFWDIVKFGSVEPGSLIECETIPYLLDFSIVILTATTPIAMLGYYFIVFQLEGLGKKLMQSGLIYRRESRIIIEREMAHAVHFSGGLKLGLVVLSTVLVIWLYVQHQTYGGWYLQLSQDYGSRKSWSDFDIYPEFAIACIVWGIVGVYYALRTAILYVRLLRVLRRLRSKQNVAVKHLQYRPSWLSKTNGWSPLMDIVYMLFVHIMNFMFSMFAVYDMLKTEPVNQVVGLSVIISGAVLHFAALCIPLALIYRIFGRLKERTKLLAVSGRMGPRNGLAKWDKHAILSDLEADRALPIASWWKSAWKVVPPSLPTLIKLLQTFTNWGQW